MNEMFNVLTIDTSMKINIEVEKICTDVCIQNTHVLSSIDALYSLMDIHVNVIIIQTDSKNLDINELLEMISSDVENRETPIVLVTNGEDVTTLAKSIESFNVIGIYNYEYWHYQFKRLLAYMKLQEEKSYALVNELNESEVRNVLDPLTGAFNRYGAEDAFITLTSRFKAYNESFSLVMLDIDFFKKVNDTYGHDIGDEVLVSLSSLLHKSIRSTDKLIRFGGEEFFIFLSNVTVELASEVAEKLRFAIESQKHSSKKLSITASFGVVVYHENELFDSLQKRVDECLYIAKEEGRNRIIYE